jgi:hypothetical protein
LSLHLDIRAACAPSPIARAPLVPFGKVNGEKVNMAKIKPPPDIPWLPRRGKPRYTSLESTDRIVLDMSFTDAMTLVGLLSNSLSNIGFMMDKVIADCSTPCEVQQYLVIMPESPVMRFYDEVEKELQDRIEELMIFHEHEHDENGDIVKIVRSVH